MTALLLLDAGLGHVPRDPGAFGRSFAGVLAIALVIEPARAWAEAGTPSPLGPPATGTDVAPPPILARSPLGTWVPLWCFRCRTTTWRWSPRGGRARLLIRLGEAIRETPGVEGLQVHCSHRVARDEVATTRRASDAAALTLATGGALPVSRSRLAAAGAAGLLPRDASDTARRGPPQSAGR